MSDEWEINVKKNSKNINLRNLITTIGNNYRDKRVFINKDYTTDKYDNTLRSQFTFINFNDNNHYLNFGESELTFLYEDNNQKILTLDNFNKITYNKEMFENINLQNIKISNSNIVSCFKIKNNNKILNIFIYEQYLDEIGKSSYIILSYFDRKNIRAVLLTSYIELLLYVLKLEYELNKNYKYSNIVNKYPNEFNNVSIHDLRIYFNNLDNVWLE
jgi:hypothetical protein